MMHNSFMLILASLIIAAVGCDADSMQTKGLNTDKRSGKRASDFRSDNVEVESEQKVSASGFAVKVQGNLPENGSGAGTYELYVISALADSYRFSLQTDGSDCSIDEGASAIPLSTPIYIDVKDQAAYLLCVEAYTAAGEKSAMFTYQWTLDLKRPDVALLNVPSEATGQSKLNLTVLSAKASAYRYAFNNADKPCAEEAYSDSIDLTDSLTVTSVESGKKRICVRSIDSFGVESDIIEKEWTYSESVPAFLIGGLPTAISTISSIELVVDPNSGIQSYQHTFLQGGFDCKAAIFSGQKPITTPLSVTADVPGLHTLCFKGQDANGTSTGVFSYSWVFDQIRKDLVITGLPEGEDPREILKISVAGTGIKEYKYALLREDSGSCGNVKYSAFRPGGTVAEEKLVIGGYTLCVIAKNNAGQTASPSRYNWSRINMPEVAIQALSGLPPTLTNATTFTNITVGGKNAESYRFGVAPGDLNCTAVTLGSDRLVATPFDIDLGPTAADGNYTLCIVGVGHFKQISPAQKYLFAVDKTPPQFQLIGVPTGTVTTTALSIQVTSQTAVQYVFVRKPGRVTCNAAPESTGRFPLTASLTDNASEGTQTLCVWTFDSANNPSAPVASTWTVDTVAPVQENLQVSSVGVESVEIRVSIGNTETGGATYRLSAKTTLDSDIQPCDSVLSSAFYDRGPFNITAPTSIVRPAAGSTTRICVYVEDAAGNKSAIKFTDILPVAAP